MKRARLPFSFLFVGVLLLLMTTQGSVPARAQEAPPTVVIGDATPEPTATAEEATPVDLPTDESTPEPTPEPTTEPTTEISLPTAEVTIEPTPEDPIELPTLEPTPIHTEPQPTELPADGLIFYDDFEADLSKWVASPNATILLDDTGNKAASLPAGESLQPLNVPSVATFKLNLWFNLAPEGSLTVRFSDGYTLTLASGAATTLEQVQGNTIAPLASGERPQAAESWGLLELVVEGGVIGAAVDGVMQFTHTTTTPPAPSQFVLFGGGAGAQIDDFGITLLREATPTEAPTPTITPTPGNPILLEMNRTKIDGALLNVMDLYTSGDTGAAFGAASDLMLQMDQRSRIKVVIWAAEGYNGSAVAQAIGRIGGRVEIVDMQKVYARLSVESIAALSLLDEVSVIMPTERLASTGQFFVDSPRALQTRLDSVFGKTGKEATEGYNVVGAETWQVAGFVGSIEGDRIGVGIIDIGFGNLTATNDLECLDGYPTLGLAFGTSAAGDTRRGLDMAEIVCDIAPTAQVRLYKATNVATLANAISLAARVNRVILIGVDLGVNSAPGDGTLGRVSGLDPYKEIIDATQDGVIVIATAGNSGAAHKAFTYTGGSVNLTIKAAPGDLVNIGWNDWDSTPNGGSPREDISASLNGVAKAARGSAPPGYQWSVPAGCSTDGNGLCTLTLNLNGLTGSTSLVQVQATGLKSTVSNPSAGTLLPDAGSIARPGDSDAAITVGAVCTDYYGNFPQLTYSGRGPVYSAGGNFTALPPAPFSPNNVKPDVVGPAQVTVRNAFVNDMTECDKGFGGSEAAAAHVAGMAVLLVNNTAISSFQGPNAQNNMKNYLRTHAVDLHVGDAPDGYDMAFGAGLAALGSPGFDPDTLPNPNTFIAPNRLPAGETCAGGFVYVGPYKIGAGTMNGSLANPYNHPTQAIAVASATPDACVIVLPGEYVTPWYFDNVSLTNAPAVYGYSSVVRVSAAASRVHVQNQNYVDEGLTTSFFGHAGIYVKDIAGVTVSGFTFTTGQVINTQNVFYAPRVFVADNADNVIFSNNRIINAVAASSTLVEVLRGSDGAEIRSNTFRNNRFTPDLLGPSLIAVKDSGTAVDPVLVIANTIRDNVSVRGQWLIDKLTEFPGSPKFPQVGWVPLVMSLDSYTDIVNNTIRNNDTETIIQIVTRAKGNNFVFGGADQAPMVARILGNAIVGNTLRTEDFVINTETGQQFGLNSGPIINLWHAQKTFIVNNTIAYNNFTASSLKRWIILRGNDADEGGVGDALDGSLGSEWARWEIINNFVYDNISADELVNDVKFAGAVNCDSYIGAAGDGARGNWVFGRAGSSGVFNGGVCNLLDPSDNNIFDKDPFPRDEFGEPVTGQPIYIVGGEDITAPGFYALSGNDDNEPDGVDEGLNNYVQTNLPDFYAGLDARGVLRVQDGDEPLDGVVAIDIGAYERAPLIVQDPILVNGVEDSGAITFDFDDFIQGGAPPYEFEITRYPKFFGTWCGEEFTFANRGVVIETLDSGVTVASYCPPEDYHTEYAQFNPADAGFEVEVADSTLSSLPTEVLYTITEVPDSDLDTVLTTTTAVGLGRGVNNNPVRLRPFVDFTNNFVFSERNATGTEADEVDYDFTYQGGGANPPLPTLVAGAPENQNPQTIVDNLVWNDAANGILGVGLANVNVPATAKLQYTVEDRRGNEVTNFIIVKAVQVPSAFNLLRPANGSNVNDIETLEEFAWQVSTPAQSYEFILEREADVNFFEPITTIPGLTPQADGDTLTCNATECSMELTSQLLALLTPGRYRWNVEANNEGLERAAANPFIFRVLSGRELLRNGSFEEAGATAKLARYWNPGPTNNKDRRRGNGVAFEQNFAYEFRAQAGTKGVITQPALAGGMPGDKMTVSGYVRSQNLQANAVIRLIVKYTTGKPDKVKVNIERGSTDGYQFYSTDLVLRGVVKKAKVKIIQNPGSGRMYADLISLVLEPNLNYKLIGPTATGNAVFVQADAVDTFMWQESGTVKRYNFQLIDTSTTNVVLDLPNLTRADDTDRLECRQDLCRLTLESPLAPGEYEWFVTAGNGLTPTNGPGRFEIDTTANELLQNPGFDTPKNANNALVPANWKVVNRLNDRRFCNKIKPGKADKIRAFQDKCSFQFIGRKNATVRLEQTITGSTIQADDLLTLSFFARGNAVIAGAGRVVATITYTGGATETMEMNILPGKTDWTYYEAITVAQNTVQSVRVRVIHNGKKGNYAIDNISFNRRGPS